MTLNSVESYESNHVLIAGNYYVQLKFDLVFIARSPLYNYLHMQGMQIRSVNVVLQNNYHQRG